MTAALALADETVRTLAVKQPHTQALDAARDLVVAAACALQDAGHDSIAAVVFRLRPRLDDAGSCARAFRQLGRVAAEAPDDASLLAVSRAETAVGQLLEVFYRETFEDCFADHVVLPLEAAP